MSKRVISCQVWEWYGSEDFIEGRYKPKGGQEFVFETTPETTDDFFTEDELIDIWNAKRNKHGLYYRYEAKSINYYFEPMSVVFKEGEFDIVR
jgi:hypothetical protein